MSVGDRSLFTTPFSRYLFDVEFIPFPDKENERTTLDQFKELVNGGDVGIFIFEPLIQAAGGMRMYSADLLNTMINYAQSNGVICIADEVFTGFGRTGKLFASNHLSVKPDLIALSKGLTGGTLPLGVTAVSSKIVEEFQTSDFTKTFFHGHSFTANPVSCAAANASFDLLMKPACTKRIEEISQEHRKFATELSKNIVVKASRSLGTILAIELKTEEQTSYTNDLRKKIYSYFMERDILLRPLGNTFYIVAPYCIEIKELHHVYDTIRQFLKDITEL
jgi:adenosylmethionine---8-amino-7-oxononanoate aminotransferase